MSYKSRANYTQATWEQLLRNELIAARPIVYSGGGHAFVCDGYDAYPNPAQTFVLIEGLQPASQVSLYSMNGKQLYTGQTDQQGALRIDLTALSDCVYLLIGKGWQKRLVVKH